MDYSLNHLQELESESIYVIREVAAQFEKPVILFSGGKDSILLTHLAAKAFYPAFGQQVEFAWRQRQLRHFHHQAMEEHRFIAAATVAAFGNVDEGILAHPQWKPSHLPR